MSSYFERNPEERKEMLELAKVFDEANIDFVPVPVIDDDDELFSLFLLLQGRMNAVEDAVRKRKAGSNE